MRFAKYDVVTDFKTYVAYVVAQTLESQLQLKLPTLTFTEFETNKVITIPMERVVAIEERPPEEVILLRG